MIEVVVREYCQNCIEFEPKAHIEAHYIKKPPEAAYIAVKCVHAQKCELIRRYLEERVVQREEAGQ